MEKKVLTFKEYIAAMRIGRTLGLKLIQDGTIAHIRLGRKILVPVAALDRVLSKGGE